MKNIIYILLVFFLFLGNNLKSQTDYVLVDRHAESLPDSLLDYQEIADYLTSGFEKEDEKVRSLYVWIAHHIAYDLEKLSQLGATKDTIDLNEVIRKGKGICQDYSELFYEMSQSVGIESYIISGITKRSNGKLYSRPHAWNGVRVDGNFYLLDMTWAAGYVNNGNYYHVFRDKYFLRKPEEMIASHLPYDPIWQFLPHPISLDHFIDSNYVELKEREVWNYKDSIRVNESMLSFEKRENSIRRMLTFNSSKANVGLAKLIQRKLDFNHYNLAIDYLRLGIDKYNVFMDHKDKRFKHPKIEDLQIQELITDVRYELGRADEILKAYVPTDGYIDELFWSLNDKLPRYLEDLEREEYFVERYLKTWKPLRGFVM